MYKPTVVNIVSDKLINENFINDIDENDPNKKLCIEDEVIDMSFVERIESKNLTEDAGIQKFIIKEGEFNPNCKEFPKPGANVKIKYEFRKNNGHLLDKQHNRQQEKNVKLFHDNLIKGAHIGIASMKPGEIAWLKLSENYHFCPLGQTNADVNKVKDQITEENKLKGCIFMKIELTECRNITNLDSKNVYSYFEHFENKKREGNEAFSQKNYDKAIKEFKKATNVFIQFPKELKKSINEEENARLVRYKIDLNNNIAQCYINLKNYFEALKYVEQALNEDPENIKGLYRYGICQKECKYFEKAKIAFEKGLQLSKDEKDKEVNK